MVAPADKAIALIGFMGAGKSRAATAIGRALGEEVLDTDDMISERLGEPLEDYFLREGEAAFRELEERTVLEALDRGGVVSLGGGAIGSERVRLALAEHVPVWCRVREEVAWQRSRGSRRPLATDREHFEELYEQRDPIYASVARVVLPRGGDETPTLAAAWISALRASSEPRIAWARSPSAEYPVIVGPGAAGVSAVPAAPPLGSRLFGVVDPEAMAGSCELPPGCEVVVEVAGGEQHKTLREAERVLSELARAGVRRDDAIVALGGGVVGDLVGFCAAVYQRGVPVVQVPTTLVAQVDSSMGGKTGVDLPEAKNYVGAFHQPVAVLSDPRALTSLPDVELAAGYAEVVKTALIAGGRLWEKVRLGGAPTVALMSEVVFDCALTKLSIVAEDERDGGRRAVLNLGHTVGHAIEVVTGYGHYRHGEAIGLGLLAALRLSGLDELRAEVRSLLAAAGLPVTLDVGFSAEEIVEATGRDKKRTAAGLGLVLMRAPGTVDYGFEISPADLAAAVEELRR